MRISVIIIAAFVCLTSSVGSHPTVNRVRRASASASASSSSTGGGGTSYTSTSSDGGIGGLEDDSDGFGFGSSSGTRLNPFFPWGAFAGTLQPGTGRIGSGCAGFSCGIQFGDFFPPFPYFGGNNGAGSYSGEGAFARSGTRGFPDYYGYNNNNNNFNNLNQNLYENFRRFASQYANNNNNNFNNYPDYYDPAMFSADRYAPEFPRPYYYDDIGARMGPVAPQIYYPSNNGGSSGFSSSSSSSSSNGNGRQTSYTDTNVNGISSRVHTNYDPSTGRVTSVQGGSGGPDVISTRIVGPGQSHGVYSASGAQMNSNGNGAAYRASGGF